MIRIVAKAELGFEARLRALVDRAAGLPDEVDAAAREVIRQVRRGGDAAIRELTLRYEKRNIDALELPASEWKSIAARTDDRTRAALEAAAVRIRTFHEHERYESFELKQGAGIRVGLRVAPLAL
ncbi:MAG TPA: histidinol dehydrogenase, partial [Polyangia bacterium]|nr:histidinol dehydrogenase [Polyangia bacterium]